jgi:hypothetical protein
MQRLARLRRSLLELFPERHLYVRSGGEMKGYVLTPKTQMLVAAGISAAALWMGVCSAAMLVNMMSATSADRQVARTQAKYERCRRPSTRLWRRRPRQPASGFSG